MTSPSDRRHLFLEEMGLGPVWRSRDRTEPAVASSVEPEMDPAAPAGGAVVQAAKAPQAGSEGAYQAATPSAPQADAAAIATMDWDELQAAVAGCTRCGLCKGRTQTVFGVGDRKARWLFIGEGPGRTEDQRGEPFVGPAGKLLDNIMASIQLKRGENAYIANIVKCRPVGADGRDRAPTPEEAATCLPYLERQIALIQPDILVALGKTAAVHLLGIDPDSALGALRGKVHRYGGRPLLVTYHPAYLLRRPLEKSKTWIDLCLALSTFHQPR